MNLTRFALLLAAVFSALPFAPARAETGTTNVLDNAFTNAGPAFTLGNTGPSNFLLVTNGGWFQDGSATIGNTAAASNNVAIVTGAGSLWENSGAFYLGLSGAANQLRVENGAQLKAPFSVIGVNASSSGNVAVVSGPQAQWTTFGGLSVGEAGSGNQLTIAAGGRVISAGRAAVGYNAPSSNNTLTITGAGSGWQHFGPFSVGSFFSDDNRATVSGGAFLANYQGHVGNGNNNRMTVTDPGTYWANEEPVFVGFEEGSNNQLILANGARIYSNSGYVAGTNNSVLVTGPNSIWESGALNSQLVVGQIGRGNLLTITNGGRVNSFHGIISGSSNSARVADAGSLWNTTDALKVGEEFGLANALTLANGGRTTSRITTLAGDNGVLLVTGPGSVLAATDSLSIGDETGRGNQLTIADGGRVNDTIGYIGGTATPFSPHGRNVGNGATVTGLGSTWNNSGDLRVGVTGGNSRFTIAAGGRVSSAAGYVGYTAFSYNGTVSIADTNSFWDNRQDLYIGYSGGGNRFTITNGAAVSNANGVIGYNYSRENAVVVTGPGSAWHNNGNLVLGSFDAGQRLLITNGARVNNLNGLVGQPMGRSNLVIITGSGSVWSNAAALLIGANNSFNEVKIEDNATALAGAVTVGNTGASFNNVLTISGGRLLVTNAGNGALTIARAAMHLGGGTLTVDRLVANSGPQSVLNFTGGTLQTRNTAVANGQPFVVGNGTSTARLELFDGVHFFADGVNVSLNAALAGIGAVSGSVTNAGELSPGQPIGALAVNGSLVLLDSASARFDLGGYGQGGSHDFVAVSNAVQFAGALRVSLANDFHPSTNAAFTLIQFASGSGSFSNAPHGSRVVVESGGAGTFLVEYTANALRLSNFQGPSASTNDIDDAWAWQYFGHAPLTSEERNADADGDGLNNYAEYVAGTNPLEAASVLRITALTTNAAGNCVLRFPCVAGKTYGISYSTNVADWNEVAQPALTTPAPNVCEWFDDGTLTGGVPSPAGLRRFYRISVR